MNIDLMAVILRIKRPLVYSIYSCHIAKLTALLSIHPKKLKSDAPFHYISIVFPLSIIRSNLLIGSLTMNITNCSLDTSRSCYHKNRHVYSSKQSEEGKVS